MPARAKAHTPLAASEPVALGHERPASQDDHLPLRLWLRLLTCANLIEAHLGQRLRQDFASNLPRFDLLAQLHRFPEGLRMKELSRRLMVTSGSVTGLADQLEREGLLQRQPVQGDRRATVLRLTAEGRTRFEAMAHEHEQWVGALFAHVPPQDRQSLYTALGRLRDGLKAAAPAPRGSAG